MNEMNKYSEIPISRRSRAVDEVVYCIHSKRRRLYKKQLKHLSTGRHAAAIKAPIKPHECFKTGSRVVSRRRPPAFVGPPPIASAR